jgi:short-subunit dehydrogenase
MSHRPVAIVTGASSGIGAETALALARRGYAVVLAARRADRLQEVAERCEQAGGLARVAVTDVAVEEQVKTLVAGAVEEFGRLDVMVNNAGFGVFARAHETTTQDMRAIFEVNFFGLFYGCKAAAAVMTRQRSGHIFNVSSVLGKRGSPFHGAYSATKFAVCGLTDALRVELMPYNIRVTCVLPALTATEFFKGSPRGRAARSGFRKWQGMSPARLVGERIAAAVGKSRPEILFSAGGRLLTVISALWPRAADAMMRIYLDDLVKNLK